MAVAKRSDVTQGYAAKRQRNIMKHYGDITKLNGWELPPVDVITGGSPCQDLSIAGRRAGLDGERSGLFLEQVRLVKEMRNATANDDIRLVKPRYMVWENVPGAFSSNEGKDFQAVLTEIARMADSECPTVPLPEKGRWNKSGCLMGEGFSIVWRVHDAQFWGVPQRRKRISLVADFGGLSAPEILFERKGLSWHSESSETEREGTAGRIEDCVREYGKASTIGALQARDYKGVGSQYVEEGKVIVCHGRARRTTPLEYERLQGFPDGWTDIGEWTDSEGKLHKESSDSARYKALGNSLALPFWFWLMRRIAAQYVRPATLGSLFDGVGGFPYVWEKCNGKGTALWASEVDEFAIAVTKKHFGEE